MLHETDLSRADLNLLVLFEAVMRERHVGRSGEALNLSPSAVSHGLSRLRVMLNDPLFIKTPRGVTPTERAIALEAPITEILTRVRSVVSTSAPFDAHNASRTFAIGAPDGVSAVFLGPLMARLRRAAPGVDIRVRQLLPRQGETGSEAAWRDAFADLDARAMDLAVMPIKAAPPRFTTRLLFNEEFVIAGRAGHAWFKKPTLNAFCNATHLVVSNSGDPKGFVDAVLAERGLERRVALTAPNFMFALALLTETDLIAAVPRRFFELHGRRFRLESAKPPLPFPKFALNMVAPKPALQDAGLAWLVETLSASA